MKYETLLPHMSWTSSTVVTVGQHEADIDGFTAVTLSDGKRRYFTGDLTIDSSVQGQGGLVATPIETSEWYQVYLVPKSGDDDQCEVIAAFADADTAPGSYTAYRYIGSFYSDGGGNIDKFYYVGSKFYWVNQTDMPTIFSGASITATWASTDIEAALIPVGVASVVNCAITVEQIGGNNNNSVYVTGGTASTPGDSPTNWTHHPICRAGDTSGSYGTHGDIEIPLRDGDSYIWYKSLYTTGTGVSLGIMAYTNKYLEE